MIERKYTHNQGATRERGKKKLKLLAAGGSRLGGGASGIGNIYWNGWRHAPLDALLHGGVTVPVLHVQTLRYSRLR